MKGESNRATFEYVILLYRISVGRVKPVRQETSNECGLACISMLAGFYKFFQPINFYRSLLHVGRDGTTLKDLYSILNSLHFDVMPIKVDDFTNFQFQKGPYIVHLQKSHYVVVQREKKDRLKFYDPSGSITNITSVELQKIASGYCIYATPGKDFKQVNNLGNDFRHIIPIVRKLSSLLSIVLIISFFSYIISLLLPLLLQKYINSFYYNKVYNSKATYLGIITLAVLFWAISSFRNNSMIKLQSKLYEKLSFATIAKLLHVDYFYFDSRSDGDILYRLQFLPKFQNAISNTFLQLIIASTNMMVVLLYLGVNYLSFLPILVSVLLIFFTSVFIMNNLILEIKRDEIQASSHMEQTITELVTSMFQIRCLHLEKNFFYTYQNYFTTFLSKFNKSQDTMQKCNLLVNVAFTFTPPILIIIMLDIYGNSLDIGALFALYSFLTTLFSQGLSLISSISTVQMLKASVSYLNDFLDEPEKMKREKGIENFDELYAKNLIFRYSDTSNNSLNDISFSIRHGERVAIIGASGCGKTTLVKLIAGLYHPNSGQLTINGVPVYEIGREVFSNVIAIVPQIPVTFNKTIRENVALDMPDVTDESIVHALKLACIWDDVVQMPQKMDTLVSGQSGNLSGGQIQRLAIARALLRSPQLIILDEATSSLDSTNENRILHNIMNQGVACIIISHRLTTVEGADRILVMDQGEIVACGKHSDLLVSSQHYLDMYNAQLFIRAME